MKNFLTLILCWLLAFEVTAATTVKIKTAQSIAGGYVTSLNKVDGSFEDGTTGWTASVGTITQTASTEFQGNFKGVWAGTGTGTLDLQWTATASNTYEASVMFRSPIADSDHYICAYVGTTETGCTLIDGTDYTPNTIRKVSVVADSIMSSAFYLRLKHTGSDAFSVEVDDGKIEPYTPNVANLVEQESSIYSSYTTKDGSNNRVQLSGRSGLSDNGILVTDSNDGYTKFTINKKVKFTATANVDFTSANVYTAILRQYDKDNNIRQSSTLYTGANVKNAPLTLTGNADPGHYFVLITDAPALNVGAGTNFSITATAIRDNVIQSWQDGTEWKSLTYQEVNALVGNQGLGAFTAGGVEWKRDGGDLLYKGKLTAGSTTNVEARLPLPSGLVSAGTSMIPSIQIAGDSVDNAPAFNRMPILIEPSVGYITFGFEQDGISSSGIVKANGNTMFSAGTIFSFTARIPIAGWSSTPTLLALPTRSEVFSSNVSTSGVVSNATQNFVTSCTNATPSVCSLWASFGVAPICWAHTLDITKRAEVTATTATTATVARTDTATAFNLFCHLK